MCKHDVVVVESGIHDFGELCGVTEVAQGVLVSGMIQLYQGIL